jgi:gliding motility-associated-like protein
MNALDYAVKQFGLMLGLFLLIFQAIFSQQITKDNNTGAWITPSSWDPTWNTPLVSAININITINGYITRNGDLGFEGGNLIINDTLIIYGDLILDNNSDITVNDNGILIIRGNLSVGNQTLIGANAYIVLTGDFTKEGSVNQGSFTSNDNPVKVFIGGAIFPIELSDHEVNFPALDCTSPPTTPYPNTLCSYGNMLDLLNDPINTFFQTTCNAGGPVINTQPTNVIDCENTIFTFSITASGASCYQWQFDTGGGMGFQNITDGGAYSGATTNTLTVTDATSEYNGNTYRCVVIGNGGCTDTSNQALLTNEKPVVFNVTGGGSYCSGGTGIAIGLDNSDTGVDYELFRDGVTTSIIIVGTGSAISFGNQTVAGIYTVKASCNTNMNGTATISIITTPTANAGNNKEVCGLNSTLDATLSIGNGTWSKFSGPGDVTFSPGENDPDANVNVNTPGYYTLTWTEVNGSCSDTSNVIFGFINTPDANAGPDQELNYKFETTLQAELSPSETGEWEIISGSGNIVDIHSPETNITGLAIGENNFSWKVSNGICENSDEITITVNDLFVPSVITPNGDLKNDYFVIRGIENIDPVELIIYNRWGAEVYSNKNYQNDWHGNNNNGNGLSEDTYFYILIPDHGKNIKGFVVILR